MSLPAYPLYSLSKCSVRPAGLAANAPDVLRELSLSLHAGETVALIGPSGAGKTTLLNTLALCQTPTQTQAFLRQNATAYGLSAAALQRLRKTHFYAPQHPPLAPRQRVINAVMAGALPQWSALSSLREWFAPSQPEVAFIALDAFGLGDKLYARVDTLSGGERQRVGLARALVAQQLAHDQIQTLLLDEPLSALDPALGERALTTLLQSAQSSGALLVASLHHVDLARAYFDRIVGLRGGAIMFDTPRADLTDVMIAELYAGAETALDMLAERDALAATMPFIRCA